MRGGSAAQLGFDFQNLFTVFILIEKLFEREIKYFAIEQPVLPRTFKEIDIVLFKQDDSKQYYEIKSGKRFKANKWEIIDALQKLYLVFENLQSNTHSNFFLITSDNLTNAAQDIITKITGIKENRRNSAELLLNLSRDMNCDNNNIFRNFILALWLEQKNKESLLVLTIDKIKGMFQEYYLNSEEGSVEQDLINRLRTLLIDAIDKNRGEINTKDVWQEIRDWLVKKRIIALNPNRNTRNYDQVFKEVTNILNTSFEAGLIFDQLTIRELTNE